MALDDEGVLLSIKHGFWTRDTARATHAPHPESSAPQSCCPAMLDQVFLIYLHRPRDPRQVAFMSSETELDELDDGRRTKLKELLDYAKSKPQGWKQIYIKDERGWKQTNDHSHVSQYPPYEILHILQSIFPVSQVGIRTQS